MYVALEDLIVFEADKDDIGIDGTIQNEGFRYVKEKEWQSADIDRCKKTIALVNAKIAHAEGMDHPLSVRIPPPPPPSFCMFVYYPNRSSTVSPPKSISFRSLILRPNVLLLHSR